MTNLIDKLKAAISSDLTSSGEGGFTPYVIKIDTTQMESNNSLSNLFNTNEIFSESSNVDATIVETINPFKVISSSEDEVFIPYKYTYKNYIELYFIELPVNNMNLYYFKNHTNIGRLPEGSHELIWPEPVSETDLETSDIK